jgi:antitoxin component of RelBE/YafQ-DinJ toxin-antitoxin module
MTKFFATFALAFSVFTLSAQEAAKPAPAATQTVSTTVKEKVDVNSRKIASKLGLTPDQQKQLRPLLTDFYTTRETLTPLKTSNPAEYKEAMKNSAARLVKHIQGILTEAQLTTFNQLASQLTAE